MKQLEFWEMEYYFRLDFGIKSRYTQNFKFKKVPNIEQQKIMVKLFFNDPEIIELEALYWFTGFELCVSPYLEEDFNIK